MDEAASGTGDPEPTAGPEAQPVGLADADGAPRRSRLPLARQVLGGLALAVTALGLFATYVLPTPEGAATASGHAAHGRTVAELTSVRQLLLTQRGLVVLALLGVALLADRWWRPVAVVGAVTSASWSNTMVAPILYPEFPHVWLFRLFASEGIGLLVVSTGALVLWFATDRTSAQGARGEADIAASRPERTRASESDEEDDTDRDDEAPVVNPLEAAIGSALRRVGPERWAALAAIALMVWSWYQPLYETTARSFFDGSTGSLSRTGQLLRHDHLADVPARFLASWYGPPIVLVVALLVLGSRVPIGRFGIFPSVARRLLWASMGAALLIDYLVRFLTIRVTLAAVPSSSVVGIGMPRVHVEPTIAGICWTFGAAVCFVVAARFAEEPPTAGEGEPADEPDPLAGGEDREADRVGAAPA